MSNYGDKEKNERYKGARDAFLNHRERSGMIGERYLAAQVSLQP